VLTEQLTQGLAALGLPLDGAVQTKLLAYLDLLGKWNRTYNLTAVRDPAQMVTRHLLDSLAVAPYVHGPRVLDIGTGAGLPGIPLALALPDLHFTLLDSNAKKTRFIRHATATLAIENIEVIQARVEQFRPRWKFDTLISRAFSDIPAMLDASRHLCGEQGQFLAMKGAIPEAELARIPDEFTVMAVQALAVPGLDAQRHLIIITPRCD
jgi:16S rRNA (guanine527-N7)-methyltransferase